MSNSSELQTLPHDAVLMQADPFNASVREASIRARTAGSAQRFARAARSLAGGVSSGLRRSARPYPLFYSSGAGAYIIDVDGNRYCDYALAWGPLILGHSPKPVVDAIVAQVALGLTYGAQHDLEFEVAERLTSIIPCAESVCFANSGTEIVQLALRLARAVTNRRIHIKFEGHYHGWADDVLVSYHPTYRQITGSGGRAIGVGLGQLPSDSVRVAEWNSRASVERIFAEQPNAIASVICEPLLCNSGCIPPGPGFLQFLRDITRQHASLLIFDEVITGFRVRLGGAQELYGVIPDLATYAKAVGAGTALSVLAGKREYMDWIANGKVVHAGTLNGNPLTLAAAKAALDLLVATAHELYPDLQRRGEMLRAGIERRLLARGFHVATNGAGPVFHISFSESAPTNYRETLGADTGRYSDFATALLDEGVLVLPDGRWYVSAAHTDETIAATLAAVDRVLA